MLTDHKYRVKWINMHMHLQGNVWTDTYLANMSPPTVSVHPVESELRLATCALTSGWHGHSSPKWDLGKTGSSRGSFGWPHYPPPPHHKNSEVSVVMHVQKWHRGGGGGGGWCDTKRLMQVAGYETTKGRVQFFATTSQALLRTNHRPYTDTPGR